jgi:hypothetical protein
MVGGICSPYSRGDCLASDGNGRFHSSAVTELDQGEAKENVSEVRSATKPIFAIFEGGGAKGIVHVGAYAAADGTTYE